MIRLRRILNALNPAPQAIFWRPIAYFADVVAKEEDGLDAYEVASFEIGNDLLFDLRHYRGHPEFTVTFYLDASIVDAAAIQEAITRAVKGFGLPEHAIAWRRGRAFAAGKLDRPAADRLQEPEARMLALKIAAKSKDHYATMHDIRRELPKLYPLSNSDKRQSPTRRNEQLWQQIVRNVVSHEGSATSIFSRGLAVREGAGIRATPAGLNYLKSVGFSD
jgi:hypothetical protein